MPQNQLTASKQKNFAQFLFKYLDPFGDDEASIEEAFHYLTTTGGNLYAAYKEEKLVGACLTLKTNMTKFLPENFLVYIAIHPSLRGQGVGQNFIRFIQEDLKTSICLHVEPQNPAKRLYERTGFTNKYLEMRYIP